MSTDKHDAARDAAWTITYRHYDPREERRREVVLALGNGVFVTRSAITEGAESPGGETHHYPGTYRAGCYDRIESAVAGICEITDTLVNLPNWTMLSVAIGQEQGGELALDRSEILDYRHHLDMHDGTATRCYVIRDPSGRCTRIEEQRLVSMADPHLGSLRYSFTPLDWSGPVEVRCAVDGRVANTNVRRYADYEHWHLAHHAAHALPEGVALVEAETKRTGIRVAVAQRARCNGETGHTHCIDEALAASTFALHVDAGRSVEVEKVAALCTSQDAQRGAPPVRAVRAVRQAGDFASLHASHASAWDGLWQRVGLDADDTRLLRSLRLHAFHILQTFSPHTAILDAGIPARGWHGEGYRGHIFWDELFVLPFLNFHFPELAREALLYRYRRLDAAREAASAAGYRGAMYPWRSASDGREVTPRRQKNLLSGGWMKDHTHLQRHIGAAVAFNVWQHFLATGDAGFLADYGAEMMLEISRFWACIAQPSGERGRYEIKGVIGPDEYHNAYPYAESPGLDNNAYTNLMAAWTLARATEVLEYVPAQRRDELRHMLDLRAEECAEWDEISRNMMVPFHGAGILSQFEGFERLPEFDEKMLPPEFVDQRRDWALDAIGKSADAFQLTKQADALTLFYLLPLDEAIDLLARNGYAFDADALRRNADYYLARTTHRSSLSRIVYAGALAQVDPARSWEFFLAALGTDLHGLKGESVAEGIHLGAMGGTLDVLQSRYLGLHPTPNGLRIEPVLPPELGRVELRLRYRGNDLVVHTRGRNVHVRSSSSNGTPIEVLHAGERLLLAPGEEISVASA